MALDAYDIQPELLAALEGLLREISYLVEDGTLPADVVNSHESIIRARAAIAKAKE